MVDTLLRAEAGGGGNSSGSSGKKTSEGFRKWLEVGMDALGVYSTMTSVCLCLQICACYVAGA